MGFLYLCCLLNLTIDQKDLVEPTILESILESFLESELIKSASFLSAFQALFAFPN